jgi:hypothetical protein
MKTESYYPAVGRDYGESRDFFFKNRIQSFKWEEEREISLQGDKKTGYTNCSRICTMKRRKKPWGKPFSHSQEELKVCKRRRERSEGFNCLTKSFWLFGGIVVIISATHFFVLYNNFELDLTWPLFFFAPFRLFQIRDWWDRSRV